MKKKMIFLMVCLMLGQSVQAADITNKSIGGIIDVLTGDTTKILVGGGAAPAAPVWTTATGTGSPVRATSPTLVTPTLGAATATTVDTGQGANELYDMDQNVLTTSSPTFVTTDLTGITDNNIPKMGASGFANSAVTDDGSGHVAVRSGTDTTTGFQVLDADGGTPVLNVDTTNERVGIGTTSPADILHISKSSLPIFYMENTAAAHVDNAITYSGRLKTSTQTRDVFYKSVYLSDITDATKTTKIQYSLLSSGSLVSTLTLLGGSVGIGTTAPDRKLDVLDATNPQIRLTHTDGTVYSDLRTDSSGNTAVTNTGGYMTLNSDQVSTASVTNTKAASQAVEMTAAASGSTGITIADNDNLDMGTGDFTLVWRGSLPDWTPSDTQNFLFKVTTSAYTGYQFYNLGANDSKLTLTLYSSNVGTTYTSSVAPSVIDGTTHEAVAVVTVGAVNTLVDFYFDGQAVGAQQTAINPGTVSNAFSLYVAGNNSRRTASRTEAAYVLNRAMTAAEVADMYKNGLSYADKWGSQTELILNGQDWTSATGATPPTSWSIYGQGTYTIVDDGGEHTTALKLEMQGGIAQPGLSQAITTVIGKNYRVSADAKSISATGPQLRVGTSTGGTQYTVESDATGSWVNLSNTFTATTTTTYITLISNVFTNGFYAYFDNISLTEIGATLALVPESIQPAPGQWLDSSSNKLHAMQPATGSSLTRPKNTFEVRWVNTWAGTHEAQYIGGVNQNVLPPNCYVEKIIGEVAGATIEDVILGDGSDTDHWVAATTGLAAGTTSFTIANPISDGTNYKLVVDPDANFTGSITWLIKGFILD